MNVPRRSHRPLSLVAAALLLAGLLPGSSTARAGTPAGAASLAQPAAARVLSADTPAIERMPAIEPAATTFADSFFREYPVFTGLTKPMSVRFASDGRAFVAEKSGLIKAFDSVSDTTPTTVVDLRSQVYDYWDRGMLGIAVDPKFLAGRPYLYAFFVYDAPLGKTAPYWKDTCPAPPGGPGGTVDGCPASSRLVRITVDPATNSATSVKGLIRSWCQQFPSHSGGGIAIGADGQLWVAGGDGASFVYSDYGQGGGTVPNYTSPYVKVNPCNDPVTVTSDPGEKPTLRASTSQGGALRAQDIREGSDSLGLSGSLIRVNPDTGEGSAGNPLASSSVANRRRMLAHGFRNPFRMVFRPGTNDLYVGNVGNRDWEEIERVRRPSAPRTSTTMPNYGWPCYEGRSRTFFATLGSRLCERLYAAPSGTVTKPWYAYSHTTAKTPTGPCFTPDADGVDQAAITGLAFYTGTGAASNYPSTYRNALFFVDFARSCLAALLPNATTGLPDPARMKRIATGLASPVDLVTLPDGNLAYVDHAGGRLVGIRYLRTPVAVATATPSLALAPVTVTLDGSASTDPDSSSSLVAWRWDLDADGAYDDATGAVVQWNVTTPAVTTVGLEVESSNGLRDTTTVVVDTTNDPPVPVIDSPAAGTTWAVGDVLTLEGHATDPQDGTLPGSALSWEVVMEHCPSACHEHVIEVIPGATAQVDAPDHEFPSHLQLRLTATDSKGAARTASIDLDPKTTTVAVSSSPAAITVDVGGTGVVTPGQATVILGGTVQVVPPLTTTKNGVRLRFDRWDDTTARIRQVLASGPSALAATYVTDAPDTCATATTTSASRTWLVDRPSGNGDVDWFRFSLGARRRVVVTVGDVPVNARLDLYSSCSTRLATADASSTARFEELVRRLPAGTYRVRVSFPGGGRSSTPYVVRFAPMAAGVPVKSWRVTSGAGGGGTVRIVGEVLNNTGATTGRATVTATFRDGRGSVVGTLTSRTFAKRLADGGVSPFVLSGSVPAYATVSLATASSSPSPARSLSLTALTRTSNMDGTVTEQGTVKNTGTSTATAVAASRTWYGTRGEVLDRGVATVSPSTLAPGQRGTFTILRPVLAGVQATRTGLRAS